MVIVTISMPKELADKIDGLMLLNGSLDDHSLFSRSKFYRKLLESGIEKLNHNGYK